jgi:hypothetical protein
MVASCLVTALRRREREDCDAIAAHRPHPDVLSDLDGDGAGCEHVAVGLSDNFLGLQRIGIDFRDI